MPTRQYIGARYVPKIYENSLDPSSAEWESLTAYEAMTIVTYNNSSYISKKPVPNTVGDPPSNPSYWTQTGFYNGQIIDIYNKLNPLVNLSLLKGKKIAIIGDSTSVSGTWTDDFINKLDGTATVYNNSVGGRRVTSLDGNWSTLLDGSTDFDIIIIALGVNDWNNDVPLEKFTNVSPSTSNFNGALVNAYTSFITYFSGSGKLPMVYFMTPTPMTRHTMTNSFGFTVDVYRKVIAGFCNAAGWRLINGDRVGILSNALSSVPNQLYMTDGLHPDNTFNEILADFVLSKLACGGDPTVSPSDGEVMDYSSYLDSNKITDGIFKVLVDSAGVHVVIAGRYLGYDPSSDNGGLIGTLPTGAGKLFSRFGDSVNVFYNIPAYIYASNDVFSGSVYLVGDEIRILTERGFTAQNIRIFSDTTYLSDSITMPDFNVT